MVINTKDLDYGMIGTYRTNKEEEAQIEEAKLMWKKIIKNQDIEELRRPIRGLHDINSKMPRTL